MQITSVRVGASIVVLLLTTILCNWGAAKQNDTEVPVVYQVGEIKIIEPWAKSEIGSHHVKLFFEFRNEGDEPDQLQTVRSAINDGPNQVIAVNLDNGRRTLSEISTLDIPIGLPTYELSEIGYYLQLSNIKTPLLMGSKFTVELVFKNAGPVNVDFVVRFHSPKLTRRIRDAAQSGDIETLKALRPQK